MTAVATSLPPHHLVVPHPECRRCTSPPASEAFVTAVASQDKVLHLVPGGYHEVLFSPGAALLHRARG